MHTIYHEVGKELIKSFDKKSNLIFPKYHNKGSYNIRVSEQESKIIFSHIFFKKEIPFSVEAPTKTKHMQKGKTPQSARYDMVVYSKNRDTIRYVIELKANNTTQESIRKDIEKMAVSDSECIWFHTLRNANEKTYKVLLEKFNKAFEDEKNNITGNHKWEFVLIVLEQKKLYTKSINVQENAIEKFRSIDDFNKKLL
jgi:hypothetical protein